MTVFNNPAFQLFLMATTDCYRLNWEAGENKMLLVSVGTGAAPDAIPDLKAADMHLYYNASHIPAALMAAANAKQDFLCRVFGKCRCGAEIDREIGTLNVPLVAPISSKRRDPLASTGAGPVKKKLFTYVRYNVDLTDQGLKNLGLEIDASKVQAIDSVAHIKELDLIGMTAASKVVDWKHFKKFP